MRGEWRDIRVRDCLDIVTMEVRHLCLVIEVLDDGVVLFSIARPHQLYPWPILAQHNAASRAPGSFHT